MELCLYRSNGGKQARSVRVLYYVEYDVTDRPNTVWKCLEAAFAVLHLTPALKRLALLFNPSRREYFQRYGDVIETYYSHQWDIIAAIGSSQYPLPRLRSLTIHRWMPSCKFNYLYNEAPIAELAASLRHLCFSIYKRQYYDDLEVQARFWNQVVTPCILQPAIDLESLEITRPDHQDLEFSELPTYPRLAALSLSTIKWGEGMISQGNDIMRFPAEDLIMRHRMTLKKLKLYNCLIRVEEFTGTPFRSWADVYNQLTEVLTELEDLVVEIKYNGYCTKYTSPSDSFRDRSSEWAERDALALERFKEVVENRKMGAGSSYLL